MCETASSVPRNIAAKTGVTPLREPNSIDRPQFIPTNVMSSFSTTKKETTTAKKVCSLCLTKLARGKPHVCCRFTRQQNIEEFLEHGSPNFKEKWH